MFDLAIRGGTVVTVGGHARTDVGIADGQIVALAPEVSGRREIDASGLYVIPGGVDVHVHFSPNTRPKSEADRAADDFYWGTRAAAAGGVTTVGNMTYSGTAIRSPVR